MGPILTKKEYDLVKVMANANVKPKAIRQVVNRSAATITRIIHTDGDFETYQEVIRAQNEKYHPKNGNGKKETDSASVYEARFQQKLLNRLDTIISLLSRGKDEVIWK